MNKKTILFLFAVTLAALLLSACGGEEEEKDMTLQNENWEDINLADKDNPTILFHFTGVD